MALRCARAGDGGTDWGGPGGTDFAELPAAEAEPAGLQAGCASSGEGGTPRVARVAENAGADAKPGAPESTAKAGGAAGGPHYSGPPNDAAPTHLPKQRSSAASGKPESGQLGGEVTGRCTRGHTPGPRSGSPAGNSAGPLCWRRPPSGAFYSPRCGRRQTEGLPTSGRRKMTATPPARASWLCCLSATHGEDLRRPLAAIAWGRPCRPSRGVNSAQFPEEARVH